MAMGIPLVTFAVGGVGEYIELQSDADDKDSGRFRPSQNFEIARNAVLLHKASPDVIAEAVLVLVIDPGLRERIGEAGRQTVTRYFSVERQMREYTNLYRQLRTWAG